MVVILTCKNFSLWKVFYQDNWSSFDNTSFSFSQCSVWLYVRMSTHQKHSWPSSMAYKRLVTLSVSAKKQEKKSFCGKCFLTNYPPVQKWYRRSEWADITEAPLLWNRLMQEVPCISDKLCGCNSISSNTCRIGEFRKFSCDKLIQNRPTHHIPLPFVAFQIVYCLNTSKIAISSHPDMPL